MKIFIKLFDMRGGKLTESVQRAEFSFVLLSVANVEDF